VGETTGTTDGFRLDRREAIRLLGGVVITFTIGEPDAAAQRRRGVDYPDDLNAFLRIGDDGRVSCFTGKIEMGQGIVTSMAQILAEELDVALDVVDMVMGDTELCPYDSSTTGSRSTKYFGPALRRAAAEARAVLLELAAEELDVPLHNLSVRDGVVSDVSSPGRSVGYAELTRGKRIDRHIEGGVEPRAVSEHTVCGAPTLRTDAASKVTGEAQFAGDIRVPGMLHAGILRPPAHGATLVRVDVSGAEKIEGARVVRTDDMIAVLHESPDMAARALARIEARWEVPEPTVDHTTIFDFLQKKTVTAQTVAQGGDLEEGRTGAVKHFSSTYLNHYVAHAPIETHTALVRPEGGRATVWASTQAPFRTRDTVARELALPPENVRVITPFVGGGFGGKTWVQQVVEAARLARLTGRPVMVTWTREEEFFYDGLRPAAVIRLDSGIDSSGRIAYWDYDNFFAGSRSSEPVYDIANHRVLSRSGRRPGIHPFSVGAWRGPGSNTNVFAMESQIDLMAVAAGMDPLYFRLHNLKNPRMRRVVENAVRVFGKPLTRAPSGRGYSVVCTDYLNTYVAAMAEVEVDTSTGEIRVERVVCAQDMGEIINPAGAELQIEGSIVMGLGYVLSEQIRFSGGRMLDTSFDSYEIPRFSWVPQIDTVLVKNSKLPPQGCGEPPITVMGGLIANAVHDAVGVRLYELPMTPERVLKAVEAKSEKEQG
jgi:isoquinoline 1-oxidoreductase